MNRMLTIALSVIYILVFTGYSASADYMGTQPLYLQLTDENTPNKLKASDKTEFIVNGDFNGSFYSDSDYNAVMTITATTLKPKAYLLAFLNSTEEGKRIFYSNAPNIDKSVAGVLLAQDTPKAAEDIVSSDFKEYKFDVKIKKGLNTVYIPPYNLTNACNEPKYLVNGLKCNAGVCISSVSFSQKESEAKVVYIKDVPQKNMSVYGENDAIDGVLSKSYMGDDPFGYTNYWTNVSGNFICFPFEVDKPAEYVIKVYYASMQSEPAVMHIDGDINNLPDRRLWLTYLNGGGNSAIDEGFAKFLDGATEIKAGMWTKTNAIWEYINNNGQSESGVNTYKKAPYFTVKVFDAGTLETGGHNVSFLIRNITEDGVTKRANSELIVNRIEVMPKGEDKEVSINTYIYNKPAAREFYSDKIEYEYGRHSVSSMSELRSMAADSHYLANKIYFNVDFVNNTSQSANYTGYIAQYDEAGVLLKCTPLESCELPYNDVTEKTRTYIMPIEEVLADTQKIKMYIWDTLDISPVCDRVILE